MLYLRIAICENSNVLSVLLLAKILLNLIFIVVPIILILMSAIDLLKIVVGDPNNKKNISMIVTRMISTSAIFFVPVLVNLILGMIGNTMTTYNNCIENATTENITFYKKIEKEREALELKKIEAEKKKNDEERKKIADVREKARQKNEEKAKENEKNNNNSETPIEGTAKNYKDVVWNVNDVTQISNLTSSQLVAVLNSFGGNAKNFIPYAQDLITAENKYQVNVFFLIGVEANESGWVTSEISKSCNNLGGVCESSAHPSNGCGRNSNCQFAYFNTPGEFILYNASLLHNGYLVPGGFAYHGTSPNDVVISYCPGCSDWPITVTSIANSLFNEVSKVM